MLAALLRLLGRRPVPQVTAPRPSIWRVRLRLPPDVVYVAAEGAASAVEAVCARLAIQPDKVLSAEMYTHALTPLDEEV
jgi:hypothetical protein